MPKKVHTLDLRAAVATPERPAEVKNITFPALCHAYCGQTTKTDRPRVLFFTDSTADLMRRSWTRREPEALLFEGRMPGVPIRYRAAWCELVDGIGRPDLHMHDLRHVAAQRLLKGGVTVGVASQILGHSSNILQRRYGHLETGALQDAALSVLGKFRRHHGCLRENARPISSREPSTAASCIARRCWKDASRRPPFWAKPPNFTPSWNWRSTSENSTKHRARSGKS